MLSLMHAVSAKFIAVINVVVTLYELISLNQHQNQRKNPQTCMKMSRRLQRHNLGLTLTMWLNKKYRRSQFRRKLIS